MIIVALRCFGKKYPAEGEHVEEEKKKRYYAQIANQRASNGS